MMCFEIVKWILFSNKRCLCYMNSKSKLAVATKSKKGCTTDGHAHSDNQRFISNHQKAVKSEIMSVPVFNLTPSLTVSRLCLGSMTFGEQNSLLQSFCLLDEAFHTGINFFDSAEMYPVPQRAHTQGRSEEYLGRWIRERKLPRHRLVLASKVAGPSGQMTWIRGGPESLDAKNITEAIDNSLLRLQTDYIDLYQIHWPDRYVPMFGETEYHPTRQFSSVSIEEQLDALGRAVDAGKIRYIGLSNETSYGIMKFLQNSYSLLCRTFDSVLAESCHHEGISLLAYSPLAMGILSGKYFAPDGGPVDARLNLFKGRYSEGESRYNLSNHMIKAATMEYIGIAKKYGLHPVSLAIAFVLRHPLVASTVFGATRSWQLQEIINGCKVELKPEIIKDIDKIHARFPNPCP
ncbi:protein tas-like isoform X2 [Ricinus communis]|uniref:protein tas-like isoform X2 n=1 Tax=Ricinus communis TaxID=3988 RepID=UPI00201A2A5F|nr:protein tas-like isoform X2 [Ricinus communis]